MGKRSTAVQNLRQTEKRIELTLGNASHIGLCLPSKWFTSGGFLSGKWDFMQNKTQKKYENVTQEKCKIGTHEKYVKTSNP